MNRFDNECNICGGSDLREFAVRSDGIPVVVCEQCGHGVVAWFSEDTASLYQDTYFASGNDSGYADYECAGDHGLAWAAALGLLLCPGGRVLDIGCADGRLLQMLPPSYEGFGIEINSSMADRARAAGAQVITAGLLDSAAMAFRNGTFNLVYAIAVLEHISDFRGAAQAALDALTPDGLLIFEVPLIKAPDDIWFRSSLEHIHYPSERSLKYLFTNVLAAGMFIGTALEIVISATRM